MGSDYIGMKMLKEQAIKGRIHDTTCNYEEGSGFYVWAQFYFSSLCIF